MRLVLFDDFIPGVLKGGNVVDVSNAIGDIPHVDAQTWMRGLIDRFDDYRGRIESAVDGSEGVPASAVRFRAPLPEPTRIACMAGNYLEGGKLPFPTDREAFLKSPSAVIGDGDTVELPDAPVPHFHHEAELGLVIGKTSTDVPAEKAAAHIFGYLNFMDVSARGVNPNGGSSFFWGKSWDTFCPLGPVIVTADEVDDPQNLDVKLWVNGDVRQNHNTSDMGRTVEETVEFITWITTMKAGDVIATGTNHIGLGPIQHGDVITEEIGDFGTLTVNVTDPWRRTWPRLPLNKMSGFESSIRAKSPSVE